MDKMTVIVPAAGAGKRLGLGHNKAFALLQGVPLLVHCLAMIQATGLAQKVVVVVGPGEISQAEELLSGYRDTLLKGLVYHLVAGGRERQDSVANALRTITDTSGYVAVHDGARPFAGKKVFAATLAAAKATGAAIAAVPVKDTIKAVDKTGLVTATLDRGILQAVQTPQIFEINLLRRAYAYLQAHPVAVTDDASLVELLGQQVAVAPGSYENLKITTPEDLAWAEFLLTRKQSGCLKR
jgi:2-C-methyl-D-erythritol 4-phosphate cytidylyltransferase